jgi:hypothetical protein
VPAVSRRLDVALLALAAVAVAGSMILLAWRLPALPDVVPGWRGVAVRTSALTVLRVPAIGGALLVVVGVYLRRARADDDWRALLRAAAVALAVKTPAEAVEMSLLGTDRAAARGAAFGATVAAVVAFLVVAAVLWRRGGLRGDRVGARWRDLSPVERALVAGAFVAWCVLATVPAWARVR